MIVDEQHRVLHMTAQEVCRSLTVIEFRSLSERTRIALTALAIYCGSTHVAWWPEYLDSQLGKGVAP